MEKEPEVEEDWNETRERVSDKIKREYKVCKRGRAAVDDWVGC